MSKCLNLIAGALILAASPALAGGYGLGRPALQEEIDAWNLDIMPDGTGLPVGSGTVEDGEMLFSENCASCHGEFAEGIDNWPKLAGGDGTLDHKDPLKTVGSYWPYLSTVYDYVRRSMPFGAAQTMSDDDVYALTAYILYSNYLIEDDFVLSNETFMDVEMPNAGGFIVDDRETAEAAFWTDEPCMENCKDSVEITMRAMVLDVTPEDEGADAAPAEEVVASAEETPAEAPAAEEPAAAALDPALVEAGEAVFKKCKACHMVGDGAKNRTGPVLNHVVGHPAAQVDGFKYSAPMLDAAAGGLVWDEATLHEFLANPKGYMRGTKMTFAGLKKDDEITAVIEYLRSFDQ